MELSLEESYVSELSLSLEHEIGRVETLLESAIKYEVNKDRRELMIATEHLLDTRSVSNEGFLEDVWSAIKKAWKKIIEYIKKIISFIVGFFSGPQSVVSDKRYYNVDNSSKTTDNKKSTDSKKTKKNTGTDKDIYKDHVSNKTPILDVTKVDSLISVEKVFVDGVNKNNVDSFMEEKYQIDTEFNEVVVKLYNILSETFNDFINTIENAKDNIKIDDSLDLDLNLMLLPNVDTTYVKLAEKEGLYKPNKLLKPSRKTLKETKLDSKKNILACERMFGGYTLLVEIDEDNKADIDNELITIDESDYNKTNSALSIDVYNKLFTSLDDIFKLALSIVPISKDLEYKINKINHISDIERKVNNEVTNYLRRTNGKYTDDDLNSFSKRLSKGLTGELFKLQKAISITTSTSIAFRRNINVWNNYFAECRKIYVEQMNLSTKDGIVLKK